MMSAAAMPEIDILVAWTRQHLGVRAVAAGPEATDELVRLLLRHWPHHALDRLASNSPHHRGIVHVGLLARAQVREVWEARHGVSPEWESIHAGLVGTAWILLLETWFVDHSQRAKFREYSRALAPRR
jgi:hypothetical protein